MFEKRIVVLGAVFVAVSAILYVGFWFAWKDKNLLLQGFFGSMAFLPLDVAVTILVIDRLLEIKTERVRKRNGAVIRGVVISEIGRPLIELFAHDSDWFRSSQLLSSVHQWKPPMKRLFEEARKEAAQVKYCPIVHSDLSSLREFIHRTKPLAFELLQNDSVLEDDDLTAVLWEFMHLSDELCMRITAPHPSEPELDHIEFDLSRVLQKMIPLWLSHVEWLHVNFPELFILASKIMSIQPPSH